MPDILYTPNREHLVTTNAWAFLHWMRTRRGIDLPDWAALQRFSADQPADFRAAIAAFARLPDAPLRLARHAGPREALVLRRGDGARLALSRDQLRDVHPGGPLPPTPSRKGRGSIVTVCSPPPLAGGGWGEGAAESSAVPTELSAPLERLWPPALLIRPLADILLHADLRPDDRLLVAGAAAWPWLVALLEGTTIILAAATPATLLQTAAEEAASVLVAPAQWLADAAFRRAGHRPDLARLRTIVASGGPLSPEARIRVYTWVKSDLLLLARTGDTLWGNPLEPVATRPAATPGFLLTPPPSAPAPR